jgi:hypothetical protein
MGPPGRCSREFGMKWRVMLKLVGPDGVVGVHEVGGRGAVAEYAPRMIGLTLDEGKHLLAVLQVHLVQAQAEKHSSSRVQLDSIPRRHSGEAVAPITAEPCGATGRADDPRTIRLPCRYRRPTAHAA